ncbi:hypothetical protein N7491_003966 [Penicillium cf. griseofulvum]|nr:hypothetical protein N7491_003966 [Penicillium cf. griseofulvum]
MAWKSLGVDRSPHFVQPSGSIKSPLAVHLFNPTFFVADSHSTITDNLTNPTIRLLYECGLSSDHCFMFDDICRRERTEDCLLFYTEDLRRPHRYFIQKIRENMSAAVEICFGEESFKEIRKTARLLRFPLWGLFKPGRFNKTSSVFFKTYERPQDLAILMATQLAGLQHQMKVKPNFFEFHFVRGKYSRLSPKQDLERQEHLQEALDAFRVAFPKTFKDFELRESRRKEERDLLQKLKEIPSESVLPMHTHPNGPTVPFLRRNRNNGLRSIIASFENVVKDMEPFHNEDSGEYAEFEIFDFAGIPASFRSWLRSQDGLKIRGLPIKKSRDTGIGIFSS